MVVWYLGKGNVLKLICVTIYLYGEWYTSLFFLSRPFFRNTTEHQLIPSTLVTHPFIVLTQTPMRPRFSFCSSLPDWDAITLSLGHYPWTRILLRYSWTFHDDAALTPDLMISVT